MSERFGFSNYSVELIRDRVVFRAYARAYFDAERLRDYFFECWRSDPALYHSLRVPAVGNKYEVILCRA